MVTKAIECFPYPMVRALYQFLLYDCYKLLQALLTFGHMWTKEVRFYFLGANHSIRSTYKFGGCLYGEGFMSTFAL